MAKYTEFIFDYTKAFRIQHMEAEYLATFKKMRGPEINGQYPQDTRTKGQKTWDPDAPLPDGMIELDAAQWADFYKVFRTAFRRMNANRDDLAENGDAIKYLDLYYGTGKLFSGVAVVPLDASAEDQMRKIKEFLELLRTSGDNKTALQVNHFIRQNGFANQADLLSVISSKKYNKDEEVRGKIRNFIYALRSHTKNFTRRELNGEQNEDYISDPTLRNAFASIDFDQIDVGFEQEEQDPTTAEITEFQQLYDVGLLQPLILNDKLRDAFKSNGGDKVTKQIDNAISKTDYKNKDSADYVAQSEKDKLTPWQQFKKDLKANADDTILKLKNRAMNDKYMRPETSKPIAVDVYGKGFDPKDGLDKFVEIAKKLQDKYVGTNDKVSKSLKFLIGALDYLKDKMPKAYAGALRNGQQGLALDIAIAKYGLRNGKSDDEINTAHEVLSKLRWGYTTSALREKLFKENLNIFGDKGLSWNKNKGVQFVTQALDKTIKALGRGAYELVNLGQNAYRRRGRFYKPGDKAGQQLTRDQRQSDAAQRQKVETDRTQAIDRRNQITLPTGFDQQAYETNKQNLETQKETLEQNRSQLLSNQIYQGLKAQEQQTTEERDQFAEEKNYFDYYNMQLQATTDPNALTQINVKLAEIKAHFAQKYQARGVTPANVEAYINSEITRLNTDIQNIHANPLITQIDTDVANIDTNISTLDAQIDPVQRALNDNETINAINEQISEYDDIIDNWDEKHTDRFESLMAFRNLVNGQGRYVKDNVVELFLGGQKKIQSKFDRNKQTISRNYLNKYWAGRNVKIAA